MTDDILRSILLRGAPDPLADLSIGTYAVINESARIAVHAPVQDHAWTLNAQGSWPADDPGRAIRHVWGAIAPTTSGGVVLVNLSAVDISGLPEPIQWCLRLQNARHGVRALGSMKGLSRVVLREGVLTFTGIERLVRIGPPYTASEDAYRQQAVAAFEFLSPALQAVARVISRRGPISRAELADALYGHPSSSDRAALDMSLSRIRQHPLVHLERGGDGLLSISLAEQRDDAAAVMAS